MPTPSPQDIWNTLNSRQQTYLQAIYQCDQEAERHEKGAFNRGQYARPASVWRWQKYAETGYGPTKLKRLIRDAGLVDSGTGSTFRSLENRKLIECRSYGSSGAIGGVSTARVDVQITALGRKVVRVALGIQLPKRLPAGTLQDYQWQAFAECYAAGFWGLSLLDSNGSQYCGRASYGGYDWKIWLRLRDYKWGDLVEEYGRWIFKRHWEKLWINELGKWVEGWTQESWIRLTPFGVSYYQENWECYRSLYPKIEAPEPQSDDFATAPQDPTTCLEKMAALVRSRCQTRGLREVATELTLQFNQEVHPSISSQPSSSRETSILRAFKTSRAVARSRFSVAQSSISLTFALS